MYKRLLALLICVSFLFSFATSFAQDPPQAVSDALADLSARVGTSLELADLDTWRWDQVIYPNPSLGCPQPGLYYAQVVTPGYQIVLVYNGTTYDYRASQTGSGVILCTGRVTNQIDKLDPTAAPATAVTEDVIGRAVCDDAMNTRLDVNVEARVRAAGLPVNLRAQPTATSDQLARMEPGDVFVVTGGPQCAEGYVWWQVLYGATSGWAAEGANSIYWVEPTGNSAAVPTTGAASDMQQPTETETTVEVGEPQVFNTFVEGQPAIDATNVIQLERFIELPLTEAVTALAWSQDRQYLAATGQSGIQLFNVAALQSPPRLFQLPENPVYDVAFSADLMGTAQNDGTVRLWDISTGGLRAVLRGHTAPALTVAFNPAGTLLASGGEDGNLFLWDTANRTQIGPTLAGHTGPITRVAFSPDGTLLASASTDGTIRLWNVASGAAGSIFSGPKTAVNAIAFSPDGATLASGSQDGTVMLWNVSTGAEQTLEGHTGEVSDLVYGQDGSVLLSLGSLDDATIRLWDAASGETLGSLPYGSTDNLEATGLALSPDGALLSFATYDGAQGVIHIWGVLP